MEFSDSSVSDRDASDDDLDYKKYEFKQRKRRKQTKDDEMLGIFANDEDKYPVSLKTMRNKAPAFSRASMSESEEKRPSCLQSEVLEDSRATPSFGFYAQASIPSADAKVSIESFSSSERMLPEKKQDSSIMEELPGMKLKSSFGAKMLARMGYKEGEGLGSGGKGIVKPIQATLRSGKNLGIGIKPKSEQFEKSITSRDEREGMPRKQKVRYKTAAQIRRESGGLPLPNALENLIDVTGRTTIMASKTSETDVTFNISQRARQEVQIHATDWRELQDRRAYLNAELVRLENQIITTRAEGPALEAVIFKGNDIAMQCKHAGTDQTRLNEVIAQVLAIPQPHLRSEMAEVIIATIAPILRRLFTIWRPLLEPKRFIAELRSLVPILQRQPDRHEALMTTVWLPHIKSNIGQWHVGQSSQVLNLLESWAIITPDGTRTQIITQLLQPRFQSLIREYISQRKTPISWIFEWLPYMANEAAVLQDNLLRTFTISLSQWTVKDEMLRDIADWEELLGHAKVNGVLRRQILPKLAKHLQRHMSLEPANQRLDVLDTVLQWTNYMRIDIAELLIAEFFPLWYTILHGWLLAPNANFREIGEWYQWWTQRFPASLQSALEGQFRQGLEMMEQVLDHGPDSLPTLPVGPQRPSNHDNPEIRRHRSSMEREEEVSVTFKDVLNSFCAQHNLLVEPLRRAHEKTGHPLFKIKGRRAFTGYLKGDILMLQRTMDQSKHYEATPLIDLLSLAT